MPPPALKPKSPGHSSPRSSDALGSTVEAALQAAGATFSETPHLSLPADAQPGRGPIQDLHRLRGAFAIARDRIRPDPYQPRRSLDGEAQKELNDSVKRLGILQPITVRFIDDADIYQVITGERRYHAACEAGLAEIPCWVQSPKEEEVLLHQIVENWQRLDMHPYDLADALARLRDANGYSQKQLARETGKSEGEISKLLALLDLDPEVQKLAREDTTGRISRRHLYAIRSLPPDQQLSLIRKAQHEGITAADMEQLAAKQVATLRGERRRGAPVSYQRFQTSHARVSFTFRKKAITADDILTAIDEVRLQVCSPMRQTRSSDTGA